MERAIKDSGIYPLSKVTTESSIIAFRGTQNLMVVRDMNSEYLKSIEISVSVDEVFDHALVDLTCYIVVVNRKNVEFGIRQIFYEKPCTTALNDP
jgi:hypothetical protein